jgi:hypothetical protein
MWGRMSLAVLLAGALSGALVTVVALLLTGGGAVNGPPSEVGTINFSLDMLTLLVYLLQAPMLLLPAGPSFLYLRGKPRVSGRPLGHEDDQDAEHGGCAQNVEVHSVGPGGDSVIAGGSGSGSACCGQCG